MTKVIFGKNILKRQHNHQDKTITISESYNHTQNRHDHPTYCKEAVFERALLGRLVLQRRRHDSCRNREFQRIPVDVRSHHHSTIQYSSVDTSTYLTYYHDSTAAGQTAAVSNKLMITIQYSSVATGTYLTYYHDSTAAGQTAAVLNKVMIQLEQALHIVIWHMA